MFWNLGNRCHCIPPLPDCFGCIVYEPTEGSMTDVEINIGEAIAWESVEEASCSAPIQNWSGGSNCQIWGPEFGVGCGTLLQSGSNAIRYQSISPEYFSGTQVLQRKPNGTCEWRKRRVKLLQQIWHNSAFRMGTYPGTFAANVCSEAIDTVTYPYVDPVDASDMWSVFKYPKPATSTATGQPAIDSRCGSRVNSAFNSESSTSGNTWQCNDTGIEAALTLRVSRLKVFSGLYGYACRNGQTVHATVDGALYWELTLDIGRAATYVSCTTDMVNGSGLVLGAMRGAASPYGYNSGPADRRNPAVDLAACPPYSKAGSGTWCPYNPLVTGERIISGTVLRWTKLIDCENDFLGNPIELILDAPRKFVDSGDGDCECMDYEINAKKLGMTGYSTTATVDPIYV
jgi:hypothetical protein